MQVVILLIVTHHTDPVVSITVIRLQMKCQPRDFPIRSIDNKPQRCDLHVSLRGIRMPNLCSMLRRMWIATFGTAVIRMRVAVRTVVQNADHIQLRLASTLN